jgi:polar amino acid transport system substrate-binding protein
MNGRRSARLAVAAVVALLATSCGGGADGSSGAATGSATVRTISSGTLTIGSAIPYPPFEFEDAAGAMTGFDVELMNEIADRLDLRPSWVDADLDTILPALERKRFDVVASAVTAYAAEGTAAYAVTRHRAEVVAFTEPYFDTLQSLTVNQEKTPTLTSVDQLKAGDRIGAQRERTGASWAAENLGSRGVDLVRFVNLAEMYDALDAGQLVGVVADLPVSLDAVESRPSLNVVQQISTAEQYAFAVNEQNTALLGAIDGALKDMLADGTYVRIFGKYFPEDDPPSYAT